MSGLKKVLNIIPKEKKIEERDISMNTLFKRVKIVTAVAFVVINVFVIFVVYKPMAETLKENQIQVFSLVSRLDYHVAEGALMRGVEASNGLSSRTMIRNAICDYKKGEISFDELQAFTNDKYADGAKTIEYLISAYRCVEGEEVAVYVNDGDDPEMLGKFMGCMNEQEPTETTVSILKGDYGILASIISPICAEEIIVGYDYVLYNLTEQMGNIDSNSICLDIISENEYHELLENSQFILNDVEITTIKKDDTYYSVGNVNDMIYTMSYETEETLFKNIMDQTQVIIIFGIAFFVFFVFIFYMFIIRYINKGLGSLENSRDTFKHIAYVDSLTKAYTRVFLSIWNESIRKSDRTYSIILIDIDHFKRINDAFGHLTGDKVLSEISGIFLEHIRNNDYFFRFGGDEFVLILEAFPFEKICEKLDIIIDRIKKIDLPEGSVGISYGTSFLETGDNLEEKINLADQKMYEQKLKKKK